MHCDIQKNSNCNYFTWQSLYFYSDLSVLKQVCQDFSTNFIMHLFIFPLWIELTGLSHSLAPNSSLPVHLATLWSWKCWGKSVLCGAYPVLSPGLSRLEGASWGKGEVWTILRSRTEPAVSYTYLWASQSFILGLSDVSRMIFFFASLVLTLLCIREHFEKTLVLGPPESIYSG